MTNQDTPTIWADMTPEQKGSLLLAKHEGKIIERWDGACWYAALSARWYGRLAYRVKPRPQRKTVTLYGHDRGYWCFGFDYLIDRDTLRITFDTIDGEPDCATICMGKLT